jgi:hypothetical protein
MLMLTLLLSAIAHHCSPASYPRLTLTNLSSPSITDKAALLTFPNRNRFRSSEDSGQTTSCYISYDRRLSNLILYHASLILKKSHVYGRLEIVQIVYTITG